MLFVTQTPEGQPKQVRCYTTRYRPAHHTANTLEWGHVSHQPSLSQGPITRTHATLRKVRCALFSIRQR